AAQAGVDDSALLFERSPHNGPVFTFNCFLGELFGESGMYCIIFRNDKESGRIFIQPVNNARPFLGADVRHLRKTGQQAPGQRSAPAAGSRVNSETRGLIDNDKVLVGMENIKL
ncbi:MAG: hypothetical protein MUP19_09955, partial [Candidatus Aminicenantes bacterium]|nr:hypothetical protein [Candidatus Aminicenantes bacterium]